MNKRQGTVLCLGSINVDISTNIQKGTDPSHTFLINYSERLEITDVLNVINMIVYLLAVAACAYFIPFKIVKQKKYGYIAVVAVAVIVCVSVTTLQSRILTFSTPEQAFEYQTGRKADLTIMGKETAMVISFDEKVIRTDVALKSEDGWHPSNHQKHLTIGRSAFDKDVSISVSPCQGTGDYYVEITDFNMHGYLNSGSDNDAVPDPLTVQDNKGSEFVTWEDTYYYAYVSDYSSPYIVTVNGKEYRL